MRKLLLAALLTGVAAGGAFAQTGSSTVTRETTTTTTTEAIQPAWRTEMKEYIVKEHRHAITPPAGFNVAVGVPVPPSVELYPFPASAPYAKYRYGVIGDESVVVDPHDRRIVEVIR